MRDFFDTIVRGQALMLTKPLDIIIVFLLLIAALALGFTGIFLQNMQLASYGLSLCTIDLTVAYLMGRRAGK